MYTQQAEDDVPEVTTIESLCMNCRDNGTTKLLLTLIPYFREVILMSFECDHCGFKNSEVQFGGKVQEQAAKIELNVTDSEDLNRQVIKSDTGSIYFPDLDFEIPKETQRGTINTIEVRSQSVFALASVHRTHAIQLRLGNAGCAAEGDRGPATAPGGAARDRPGDHRQD
jgi:C4-type Zn-finger protein